MRLPPGSICIGVLAVVISCTIECHARQPQGGVTFAPRSAVSAANVGGTMNTILDLRGGAKKRGGRTATLHSSKDKDITVTGKQKVKGSNKQDVKKSAVSDQLAKYKAMLPLTRVYITMVGIVTLLGLVLGEEMSQGLLALDPIRVMYGFELWRPFTAACFLGSPSIGWLMNAYYLFTYGSSLERGVGTAQHLLFLMIQICILSVFSAFFGLPFFAQSVITSMLHVLSRSMPTQPVKWLVFTVPYWTLPYGLMASDALQAGSSGGSPAAAALPHILGILSGHIYFFHKSIWPRSEGAEDWLNAPTFLSQRLDVDPNAEASKSKESINKALKSRKKGKRKGRKLGV